MAKQRLDHPGDFGSSRPCPGCGALRMGQRWEARPGEALGCYLASSLSPGLGGLWLVPLGNIQVLACNRYLPGGLLGCSLRRDWAARRLLGSSAGMQGLEAFPWLLSPPPGLPRSLGVLGAPLVLDSHQPWAFGGFNPCVFGGVSPFSLLFSRPLPLAAPLSMSVTTPLPSPTPWPKQQLPEIEP